MESKVIKNSCDYNVPYTENELRLLKIVGKEKDLMGTPIEGRPPNVKCDCGCDKHSPRKPSITGKFLKLMARDVWGLFYDKSDVMNHFTFLSFMLTLLYGIANLGMGIYWLLHMTGDCLKPPMWATVMTLGFTGSGAAVFIAWKLKNWVQSLWRQAKNA